MPRVHVAKPWLLMGGCSVGAARRCIHKSGRARIHEYPTLRKVDREASCRLVQPCLRHVIGEARLLSVRAVDGRDIDDPAVALLSHAGTETAGQHDGGFEVDGEDSSRASTGSSAGRLAVDACAVDEDFGRPHAPQGPHRPARRPPAGEKSPGKPVRRGVIHGPGAVDPADVCALADEPLHDCGADTAARTRDEGTGAPSGADPRRRCSRRWSLCGGRRMAASGLVGETEARGDLGRGLAYASPRFASDSSGSRLIGPLTLTA